MTRRRRIDWDEACAVLVLLLLCVCWGVSIWEGR